MFQGVIMNIVPNVLQGFVGSDDVVVKQTLPTEIIMAILPTPERQGGFIRTDNGSQRIGKGVLVGVSRGR